MSCDEIQKNDVYNRNNYNNVYINNSNNRYQGRDSAIINPSINIRKYRKMTPAGPSWDKAKGPYGVRFDEMEGYKQFGKEQYKNDLEYLMGLKDRRHGDMTQEEWEAYNRKLHYMNDVNK